MSTHVMTASESDVIVGILALVDMSLVGSLLLMIIFSGYEIFVSKIDEVISNALVDLPKTLSALDASTLSSENKSIINDEFNISHWLKWHVFKLSFKIQFIC